MSDKTWKSLNEFHQTPEYKKARDDEFSESPIDVVFTESHRRDFIKLLAAGMAVASSSCIRRPVEKIIPYVVKPEETIIGKATYYASSADELNGASIIVKTVDGRPIKIDGNPDSPLSQGALELRGHGAILNLYDPDRLKHPTDKAGKIELSFETVDKGIADVIKTGKKVYVVTKSHTSPTLKKLESDFGAAFPNVKFVRYNPTKNNNELKASEIIFGEASKAFYRLDRAKFILAVEADFLGVSDFSTYYAKSFSKLRDLSRSEEMVGLVSVESVLTNTGMTADSRIPLSPASQIKFMLGLLNELVAKNPGAYGTAIRLAVNSYSADSVSDQLGIDKGLIKTIAKSLADAGSSSLIAVGENASVECHIVANIINSVSRADGNTVDYRAIDAKRAESDDFSKIVEEMSGDSLGGVIFVDTNPAYDYPDQKNLQKTFEKFDNIFVIADRYNETSLYAKYTLPKSHFLETWSDAEPIHGVYHLGQPVIRTMYDSRSYGENLLKWAGAAGKGIGANLQGVTQKVWHDIYSNVGTGVSFDGFWNSVLSHGTYVSKDFGKGLPARAIKDVGISKATQFKDMAEFELVVKENAKMGGGNYANVPWLQELPDPASKIVWDNYASMSPKTAEGLGVKNNDVITIKTDGAELNLAVVVQPGHAPKVVSTHFGYGRTKVGQVGNNIGVNTYPFLKASDSGFQQYGIPASLKKTSMVYKLVSTQEHHHLKSLVHAGGSEIETKERPIALYDTHANWKLHKEEYKEIVEEKLIETPRVDVYPPHAYTMDKNNHRWKMVIDLTKCTGCNVCTIACQSENNIPSVGKYQVSKNREMHWIRIDRYYSGNNPNEPERYINQPMLCQHCENAPCENVCPVAATSHDNEGLNLMTYNRCVGTRYCSNNCPYKVRRFNYLNFTEGYVSKEDRPLTDPRRDLAHNPSVTVRSRGVIEKCTFCIQRLHDAKNVAKSKGQAKIHDGQVKTACQQACPSDAIYFGDANDEKSTVSRMLGNERGYQVLRELNTKPSVHYLSKIYKPV